MSSNRLKNQHLLWRAGFGPMAENSASLDKISQSELWKLLVKTSAGMPEKIQVTSNIAETLKKEMGKFNMANTMNSLPGEKLTPQQRKYIRQQSREDIKNLNISWLNLMINDKAQLREKMSLFWHGHFSSRVINGYFQQELLQIIRENALGNFKDMLKAVSKSASMLQFLNNQQNRKKHPNENFAREVMELFTIGRGHYSESDVKEAARAFTGWGYNINGEFVFRENQHDAGEKSFMDKSGNYSGDDILDILLAQPQTAVFITGKIYKYFVNENIDADRVNILAQRFYKNSYNIQALLSDIFESKWFYEVENIGNQVKSPVVLLAGIRRFLPMKLDKPEVQLLLQRLLGQFLFFPPNVAGWPGGKSWIDSSSLMLRLRIPEAMSKNTELEMQGKNDDDLNMGEENTGFQNRFGNISIEWPIVYKIFSAAQRDNLPEVISASVLQQQADLRVVNKFTNKQSRESYISSMIIQLMSTPEYQLC